MEDQPKKRPEKIALVGEVLKKIRHYCAYQERSHREVKDKLVSLGVPLPTADEILTQLITEGFINEERFARAFAGGKFRMKKWGRLKIENELKVHGLTTRCIRLGLSEIDMQDYRKALAGLLEKKGEENKDLSPFIRKRKQAAYALAKGYEPDLIWMMLEDDR